MLISMSMLSNVEWTDYGINYTVAGHDDRQSIKCD